ncbi:hypothetical protein MMC22_003593 [Lobaria immixta]|nr:hypothetical protein [Lobaria immixta]
MAEVIGLISGIITVIEVINKANAFVRTHVHTNSSVRNELVPVLAKVTAFSGLLQALKLEAEFEDPHQPRLNALAYIDGPLYACESAMKAIGNRLDRIISVGNIKLGKFFDKECVSALKIIDETKPILELALAVDQKTLLNSIKKYVEVVAADLQEVRAETNESLQRLQKRSAMIEAHIVEIKSSKANSASLEHQEKILIWTSSLDYRSNFHAARKHTVGVPGTGRWFIDGVDFRRWRTTATSEGSSDGRAILLQGIPGAGKTVLSSTIVDEIMQTCSPADDLYVAYYFFDFNDPAKQTVEGLLRCLIFQLAVSTDVVPKALEHVYARHHKDRGSPTQPTIKEWIFLLEELLEFRQGFHIIIDALDECLEEGLLHDTIESLLGSSKNSIRWLFTRRVSEEVALNLNEMGINIIRIETAAVDHDIARYLHATLENEPKLRSFSKKAKSLISSEIETKSRGMFRWAQCQLDALKLLKDRRLKTVGIVLSLLPEDLHITYERTLLQLCSFHPGTAQSNKRLVFRILMFVAFSGRPVTTAEAAEFTVIENSADRIQEDDRFDDPAAVLSFVGSLVSVRNQILTLSHKSVKDFLESPRALHGPLQLSDFLGIKGGSDGIGMAADIYIGSKCLGYLTLPQPSAQDINFGPMVKDPNTTYLITLQKENPLLDYAASSWSHHLRTTTAQQNTRVEMDYALRLDAQTRRPNLWQGWLFLQRADIWEQQLRLAILLCDCFIRSTLVHGWANNFWHFRQKYRAGRAPINSVKTSMKYTFPSDEASTSPLALRSQQFYDLAILLLEVAYQKSLYDQHRLEVAKAQTVDDLKTHIKLLKERSKDVIPRMGEGYHEAIFECLNLIVHRDIEGPEDQLIFDTQRVVLDMVLQPLRSSASSGFRISRRVQNFKATDIVSMFAKVKEDEPSNRHSTPVSAFEKLSSRSNEFSRTHGLDGSVRKTPDRPAEVQSTIACRRCKKMFPSWREAATHRAEKGDYCPICQVCLLSGSLETHTVTNHREEPRDMRWSVL